jgi:DNA-binding transcriptional regulator GbsR (MarR family)
MTSNNVGGMIPLVRFFEKIVEWLGLSRNAGSLLAVLYSEKYGDGERLSLEQLADATSYSRSNVTLILSQLEALGIVDGETDLSQTGRGRRRLLYRIREDVPSPFFLMLRTMDDRLRDSLGDIESLRRTLGSESAHLDRMLDDFAEAAQDAIDSIAKPPEKVVRL